MNFMRRPTVSIRHLQAFQALAEQRHFTRAAVQLHLSQPAFSALIAQLENALGARLFERSTRHVELTAEGADFALAAQRVLSEFDAALTRMSDLVGLRRGRVSIALLPSLAANWLPPLLQTYCQAHPGIEIQVSDVLSEACVQQVRNGQADFALAAMRVDTPELQADAFCADGFHLVCPAGHALLQLPRVRPHDVGAYPFIHLARSSSVRQYLDASLQPLHVQAVMEVEQLATVRGMVMAGLGVSIVPALTLYQFRGPALATRPLHWRNLQRRIFLIQRRGHSLPLAAQQLLALMRQHRPTLHDMG